MRNTLLVAAMLAIGLGACGKKEEAQTEAPPAPMAEAPAPAPVEAPAPMAEAPAAMAEAAAPAPAVPAAVAPAPAPAPAAPAPAVAAGSAAGASKYTASCASCHGAKGQGIGTFPKLVGLTADTVKSRMATYKAGKQVGPQSAVMMPIASMLSDAEVDALATHIATLK